MCLNVMDNSEYKEMKLKMKIEIYNENHLIVVIKYKSFSASIIT